MAPTAAVRAFPEAPLTVDRRRQLERLRAELSHRQADWRREEREKRCPTGRTEVDALLAGGFAKGLVTSVVGAPGAGATSLVAHAVALATRAGAACAWVDGDRSLSAPTLVRLGVELPRLLWARPPPQEVGLTAQLLARSGAFALVVVDVPEQGLPTGAAHRLVDAARAGNSALVLVSRERPAVAAVRLRVEASLGRPRLALVGPESEAAPRRQVRLWVERSPQGGEASALVRLDAEGPPPASGFRPDAQALRRLEEHRPGPTSGTLPLVQLAKRLHTRPVARRREELAFSDGSGR